MVNKHPSGKRIDESTGVETVGHEWDGIEELNNPLPRWWLWTFYACIVFAIGYGVAYPAWPLLDKGTEGTLGWTSRGQLANEVSAEAKRKAPIFAVIAATPIEQLPANPDLMRQAVAGGKAAFKVNCVQCHGSEAQGSMGYPNLNDDDWLWGGTLEDIRQTLRHGVRYEADPQTRNSQMPAFGRDGILDKTQISDTAEYVLSLSGLKHDAGAAGRGAKVFAEQCTVCHGATGGGDRAQGAPSLRDAIWLYGGDRATIVETITSARRGVMPAWGGKLDDATIKQLTVYIHSLGGGESSKPAPAATGAETPAATP
jgi:cytochrome c oxidase cbb3-type subunit 3